MRLSKLEVIGWSISPQFDKDSTAYRGLLRAELRSCVHDLPRANPLSPGLAQWAAVRILRELSEISERISGTAGWKLSLKTAGRPDYGGFLTLPFGHCRNFLL